MKLQRAAGRIENLRIIESKQSIVFGPQMQGASGISAIVFAVAGMDGAAVQTSMNANDAVDDVTLYSFDINGVKYAGCTRSATFKNGDDVEVAYDCKRDGNEVLAVRRPTTRSVWLYPYMSRGTLAAKRFGIHAWLQWSLVMGAAFVVFGAVMTLLLSESGFDYKFFAVFLVGAIGLSLAACAFIVLLFAPKFLRFARAADEVFAVFGYSDPKKVDLGKTSKAHRKIHGIPWTWENKAELWY